LNQKGFKGSYPNGNKNSLMDKHILLVALKAGRVNLASVIVCALLGYLHMSHHACELNFGHQCFISSGKRNEMMVIDHGKVNL
jgi:hypothetical protein